MGHYPKCMRVLREGPTRSGKGRARPGGPPHPASWLCHSSPVARKWEGWTVRCWGAGLASCLLHSPAGAPRERLISPLSACSADGRGSRGTWGCSQRATTGLRAHRFRGGRNREQSPRAPPAALGSVLQGFRLVEVTPENRSSGQDGSESACSRGLLGRGPRLHVQPGFRRPALSIRSVGVPETGFPGHSPRCQTPRMAAPREQHLPQPGIPRTQSALHLFSSLFPCSASVGLLSTRAYPSAFFSEEGAGCSPGTRVPSPAPGGQRGEDWALLCRSCTQPVLPVTSSQEWPRSRSAWQRARAVSRQGRGGTLATRLGGRR